MEEDVTRSAHIASEMERLSHVKQEEITGKDRNTGYFKLVSAMIHNSMVMPSDPNDARMKKQFIREWVGQTKIIQMWADVAGYDESTIKRGMLKQLN